MTARLSTEQIKARLDRVRIEFPPGSCRRHVGTGRLYVMHAVATRHADLHVVVLYHPQDDPLELWETTPERMRERFEPTAPPLGMPIESHAEAGRVIGVVLGVFGLSTPTILGRSRAGAPARMILYWTLRRATSLSYSQIGWLINRDHSTIQHGVRVVQRDIDHGEARVLTPIALIGERLGRDLLAQ